MEKSSQDTSKKKIRDNLTEINDKIRVDLALKKGKRTKHNEYREIIDKMYEEHQELFNDCLQLRKKICVTYYNLVKLGDSESSMVNALKLLEQVECDPLLYIKWTMQLAALKSSHMRHENSYELARQAMPTIQSHLQFLQNQTLQNNLKKLIESVLLIVNSQASTNGVDSIVWLYNHDKNCVNALKTIQHSVQPNEEYSSPFMDYNFHISEYMSLENVEFSYLNQKPKPVDISIQEAIIYLSICCFTCATEKYFQKNYTEKYWHFKALKIALLCFSMDNTYVRFLCKVLIDHYGRMMNEILEEQSNLYENNQLMRALPLETPEISMIQFKLADDQ